METGPAHVRLVRCPKCQQLLAEVANLSVYSCGGCGALLQAKNWKKEAKSAGSAWPETDGVLRNELNHVSEDKELSILQNEANPSPDYLADHNSAEDQDQEPGVTDLSDENQYSGGSHFESTPSAGAKPEEEAENDILAKRVASDGLLSESSISELSGMLRDLAKSSIPIGPHAYDGSVSSYDELEDDRYTSASENTHNLIRREQFLVDSVRYINPEIKQQSQQYKKLHAMKGKEWECEETWEPTRRRHSPKNGASLPPKVPQYQRVLRPGNRTGGFSSQAHREYKFDHSSKPETQDQEKIELLRMIYELKNQLDKKIPTSLNNKVPESNYPMHYGRSRLGSNSAQQFNFSRTANDKNGADSKCLHCHPHDWQSSAPLPYKRDLSVVHHVHNRCNLYESKSDDQKFKDQMMKKYSTGNHHVAKRHFRPKAGGAPFITCYHCSKLLQLPEDFLTLKRRCHKLCCGSCSTTLKFSVQNRTHIIPYSTTAMEPPPSEVDECSRVMDMRNMSLSSHASNCPHVDSGLSFCRSCSSMGDHTSFKPMHALQDYSDDKELFYAKKKFIRKQFPNKCKDPVEAYEPSSSKYTAEEFLSDSEVLQPRSRSQLHRLMGYSSPSVVIRGTRYPADGTRS